ncbi:helix-turn-helix transcriptional regulator [Paenibacillus sp. FSL P4-0338]|uniref:helix-turn-helix domain-containing protein n=1 Tax=unclassified Paenibacillus TaxID=185978 RepID=UPI0003E22B68|nr:helix-turn-helix transcriptional regulator [Paenibacillus sp. FSL R7-269]ETT40420.1 helix-turn-helix domain-containing protein [Paenibacillus sp. FSL R7-269]
MVATIATIRDALAMYLSQQGMSIHQFSIHTGINSGTLSRLLKGQQPIAMDHLVRITQGMELPEDHFYSLYVDECSLHSPPHLAAFEAVSFAFSRAWASGLH